MFTVKICGVTRVEDALAAARAGADAIGLNFFAGSKRFVAQPIAEAIADSLPSEIARVGVFVNAPIEEVIRIHDQVGLDWIQLHGDEPPATLFALGERQVIRAFRCRERYADQIVSYLDECDRASRRPAAILVDAFQPGEYGGTGRAADWSELAAARSLFDAKLILAGGLNASNVGQAIETVRPDGVDTASGVESSPGVKDPAKIAAFVEQARAAFERLSG